MIYYTVGCDHRAVGQVSAKKNSPSSLIPSNIKEESEVQRDDRRCSRSHLQLNAELIHTHFSLDTLRSQEGERLLALPYSDHLKRKGASL